MSYHGFGGPQPMAGAPAPVNQGALPWAVRPAAAPSACMPVAIFHFDDGRVVSMPLHDLFDGVLGVREFIEKRYPAPAL